VIPLCLPVLPVATSDTMQKPSAWGRTDLTSEHTRQIASKAQGHTLPSTTDGLGCPDAMPEAWIAQQMKDAGLPNFFIIILLASQWAGRINWGLRDPTYPLVCAHMHAGRLV
jgi:hypothetical protein